MRFRVPSWPQKEVEDLTGRVAAGARAAATGRPARVAGGAPDVATGVPAGALGPAASVAERLASLVRERALRIAGRVNRPLGRLADRLRARALPTTGGALGP